MAEQTDRELVLACQKGDDSAFQVLMHRNVQPIWGFVRQYAKSDDDAEDITQDTFFKAWKHIKRFQADKAFRPWLYAIARNTALDHLKKRRASTFSELDGDDSDLSFADTLEDEELSPAEAYEISELSAELEEAMSVLHPDHRAALVMHYRDQMTFDEIAVIMDKPMNTVKSWHRRALGRLRGRLPHRKA